MCEINQDFFLLNDDWKRILEVEFKTDYFKKLKNFLLKEYQEHLIYPPKDQILFALNQTPVQEVKVVIIGQDPYHGEEQAHGLAFSVNEGIALPPSLKNIFKELKSDLDIPLPKNGNLTKWAKQGVLLLNTALTVRKGAAGSHQNQGWEKFTDSIIQTISKNKSNVVFLLWGKKAQEKEKLINHQKHAVLKAAHPSPFSAYNGFFGCKHFSKTNKLLMASNQTPIDWSLK